jgi:hypothetical protein
MGGYGCVLFVTGYFDSIERHVILVEHIKRVFPSAKEHIAQVSGS